MLAKGPGVSETLEAYALRSCLQSMWHIVKGNSYTVVSDEHASAGRVPGHLDMDRWR